ncbi:MAG: HEAT repeat domain-containing protein, partial [Spirochaetaceae bacterium]|nr:HEAT repeat domain-containing protein [Spirochaetaceae bacterium]
MKKGVFFCLCVFFTLSGLMADEQKSVEDQRRDTLRYGTENEIAELIRILRAENSESLDPEIIETAQVIKNGRILAGIFGFFAERDKGGLEEKARDILEFWDEQLPEAVRGALDYLGQRQDTAAVEMIMALVDDGDLRYMNNAVRALGRVGLMDQDRNGTIADYLISYFEDKMPSDDTAREIITALGSLENPRAVSFLTGIAGNNDERSSRRITALQALSKIGDREGLGVVLETLQSSDPNVRAAAVAALGPFEGRNVDQAILEAFRDTYYR